MAITKFVPMTLIDPPALAMRSEMDDDKLRELADDIARNGLTNPVTLRPVGERYEITAGHRRYVAHQLLARAEIEARIIEETEFKAEMRKMSENLRREDVNPADMAVWLGELVDKFSPSIDDLKNASGLSEATINNYLDLLRGYPEVLEALRLGQIKIGHAQLLNKQKDAQLLRYWLDYAIKSTPPVTMLRNQIAMSPLEQMPAPAPIAEQQINDAAAAAGVVIESCQICDSNSLPHLMTFIKVHRHCYDMVRRAIDEQAKG